MEDSVQNFQPSELQKRLWQVELEMADVLLRFCKAYNLKVWACFGTLLGAVRHRGFIPWDDDMDFVMMRADYDKLLSIAKLPPTTRGGITFRL